MAQVKFNRGNYGATISDNDAISFLHAVEEGPFTDAAPANDYGFIYLGGILSATKYLKMLDTAGFPVQSQTLGTSPNTTTVYKDSLVSIGHSSSALGTIGSYGIDDSTIVGTSGYTPLENSIMTSAGVAEYVTSVASLDDKYHKTGSWGNPSAQSGNTDPFKYIATFWQDVHGTLTEITPGTSGYQALEFTLPVTTSSDTFGPTDDTHITTPAAVAKYFANLAGGMRYCGPVSSTTLPTGSGTSAPYKSGDIFIASSAFTIGTSPNEVKVEVGDMIVLTGTGTITQLTTSNCDVFERNLDGAVQSDSNIAVGQLVVGKTAGTKIVTPLTVASGSLLYGGSSNAITSLAISSTAGQILTSSGSAPQWSDHVRVTNVALKSGTVDTITVTKKTNNAADVTTDIQIKATQVTQYYAGASNQDRPVLITHSSNPGTTSTTDQIDYGTTATINPSTGDIKAHNTILTQGTGTSAVTIDVYDTLLWHELL